MWIKLYEYLHMPPTYIASPTGSLYTMQQKLEVSAVQVIRLRVWFTNCNAWFKTK